MYALFYLPDVVVLCKLCVVYFDEVIIICTEDILILYFNCTHLVAISVKISLR